MNEQSVVCSRSTFETHYDVAIVGGVWAASGRSAVEVHLNSLL